MSNEPAATLRAQQEAWKEHDLVQLRYFRSLSLREKLEAVQGMADVVRHLREMRAQGRLRNASEGAERAAPDRGEMSA
jgi:hypothetical protein